MMTDIRRISDACCITIFIVIKCTFIKNLGCFREVWQWTTRGIYLNSLIRIIVSAYSKSPITRTKIENFSEL